MRLERVQDVELGQRDAVDAAGDRGLAHQHAVEPAAAPFAPRHRAELVAARAQRLADVVDLFGRERPFADARRVALGDAQHIADLARPDARARRRLSRHRVGRGDIGIGAVIDVEQHGLRALEQDALARAPRRVQLAPARADKGQDFRRDLGQRGEQRAGVDLLGARAAAQRIVMRQQPVDLRRQRSRGPSGRRRGWRAARPCPRRPARCRAWSCPAAAASWKIRAPRPARGGSAAPARRSPPAPARRA